MSIWSLARVDSYEKHKKDLRILKRIFKTYAPEKYNEMFRSMKDNTYSAYAGSVNTDGRIARRGVKHNKTDEFYKALKKILGTFPDDEDTQYVLNEIEKGTFLPKQLTSSNGVIPNQVHMAELKKILKKCRSISAFFAGEGCGWVICERKDCGAVWFQIPYYVGPLVNRADNSAWW